MFRELGEGGRTQEKEHTRRQRILSCICMIRGFIFIIAIIQVIFELVGRMWLPYEL